MTGKSNRKLCAILVQPFTENAAFHRHCLRLFGLAHDRADSLRSVMMRRVSIRHKPPTKDSADSSQAAAVRTAKTLVAMAGTKRKRAESDQDYQASSDHGTDESDMLGRTGGRRGGTRGVRGGGRGRGRSLASAGAKADANAGMGRDKTRGGSRGRVRRRGGMHDGDLAPAASPSGSQRLRAESGDDVGDDRQGDEEGGRGATGGQGVHAVALCGSKGMDGDEAEDGRGERSGGGQECTPRRQEGPRGGEQGVDDGGGGGGGSGGGGTGCGGYWLRSQRRVVGKGTSRHRQCGAPGGGRGEGGAEGEGEGGEERQQQQQVVEGQGLKSEEEGEPRGAGGVAMRQRVAAAEGVRSDGVGVGDVLGLLLTGEVPNGFVRDARSHSPSAATAAAAATASRKYNREQLTGRG